MTYRQFIALDEERQQEAFIYQGVQVAERIEAGCLFHLYQVHGFYIEVKYNLAFNKVQSSIAFQSMHKLEPYLQQIVIEWPY